MRRQAVVIAGLLIGLALITGCTEVVTPGEGSAYLDTVTASGSGKALAAPDTAEMSFGVEATDAKSKPALDRATAAAEAVSSAVQKAGVKKEDVQTSGVRIEPVYEETERGKAPRVTAYRAIIDMRVRIRDVGSVGAVIEAASTAGATGIGGPWFKLEDDAEASDEAIADAVEDARRRAQAMAESSGKKLGGAVRIYETQIDVPQPNWSSRSAMYSAEQAAIEPGQLDVTADITVMFDLE